MTFIPPRRLGLLLGGLWLLILTGAVGVSLARLGEAGISGLVLLWIALPLISIPLIGGVLYRVHGLITARYHLDRDGFYLRWGLAREQMPLSHIQRLAPVTQGRYPRLGFWWPGCMVGRRNIAGLGTVEYYATRGDEGALLLETAGDRHLIISPPDPEAFRQSFVEANRLGSLEIIPERSEHPDFFFTRIWSDVAARSLILLGLVVPLLLLGYLGLRAGSLPSLVPFGFDANGGPSLLAPPGRLLLLPLIAGFCWLSDLGLGAWFYRRKDGRPLAYLLWAIGVLTGGMFFGAAMQLLS